MSFAGWFTDAVSWGLIGAGAIFLIIGAVGVLRFPDFWSRLHAASVIDSAGMILMVAGMTVQAGLSMVTVKLVLIGLFLFLTGPTSTHAVANGALITGMRPKEGEGLVGAEPMPLSEGPGAGSDADADQQAQAPEARRP